MANQLISVGVDWIACTQNKRNAKEWVAFEELGDSLIEREVKDGQRAVSTILYGYRGIKVNSVFFGSRADGSIIQVSGKQARTHYKQLAEISERCTRLDLQATVLISPYDDTVAYRAAEVSSAYHKERKLSTKVGLWDGYGNGDTCYIGSMKSEQYCKLYDKGKESRMDEYEGCWRYEVVYRRHYATSVLQQLVEVENADAAILTTVHNFFRKRGVKPHFLSTSALPLIPPPEPPTALEAKLKWIQKTLGPMFNQLIADGHGGRLAAALPIQELMKYNDLNKLNLREEVARIARQERETDDAH